MPTITNKITTGADDGFCETFSDTSIANSYAKTYIELGEAGGAHLLGALRFQSVNIPQGSIVSSATLTLIESTSSGTPKIKVYGNNVNNAGAWGAGNRVKNIAKTSQNASVNIASTSVTTITSIVQAIVNRAGWAANNAMAFGLFNTAIGAGTNLILFFAFEKGGSDIPALSITYSTSGGNGCPIAWVT